MLKTSGYALGFQHSPRDLANVNEWKIIFDPYIVICIFITFGIVALKTVMQRLKAYAHAIVGCCISKLFNDPLTVIFFFFFFFFFFFTILKHFDNLCRQGTPLFDDCRLYCHFVNMSWQRSFWFRVQLTKQLKRDTVGHGEVTINNAATVLSPSCDQHMRP